MNPQYTNIPPKILAARTHLEAVKCARYFLTKVLKKDPSLVKLSKNLPARDVAELDGIIDQCADLLGIRQFKK